MTRYKKYFAGYSNGHGVGKAFYEHGSSGSPSRQRFMNDCVMSRWQHRRGGKHFSSRVCGKQGEEW